jgi:hypothetical protein
MNALAEGNYGNACALLDPQARRTVASAIRPTSTCRAVFSRCLPNNPETLKRDQAQLFYANVDVTVHGSRADAHLSGSRVANAISAVTLARKDHQWVLTSYGRELRGCPARVRHGSAGHKRRGHKPGRG